MKMSSRKPLKNREERTHNVVPILPYDNTSNAYRKETPKRTDAGFGFFLSIAIIVFTAIFFLAIYDMVVQTWERIK